MCDCDDIINSHKELYEEFYELHYAVDVRSLFKTFSDFLI